MSDGLTIERSAPLARPCQTGGATPWLSILVPVYNVLPYLRDCIDSIVSQLDGDGVEILLLDDASTDGSRELAQAICDEHGGLITLHRHAQNGGLSAARNTLLDAARGDYVWFLDSDDMLLPGALRGLRQVIAASAPDIVLCNYRKTSPRMIETFRGEAHCIGHNVEALVRGVFARRRMHSWSKISRRRLWADDLRFPVGRCFEDIATTPWLLLRAASYYYVPEAWVFYRVRPGSIMSDVTRARKRFDRRKNDELATAMLDFKTSFAAACAQPQRDTLYSIAHFCAKEFTKIGWRLVRSQARQDGRRAIAASLRSYLALEQQCSPMRFDDLAAAYLRRLRIDRWLILRLFLLLAGKSESVPDEADLPAIASPGLLNPPPPGGGGAEGDGGGGRRSGVVRRMATLGVSHPPPPSACG